jgi:electron transport complex protein RnfA
MSDLLLLALGASLVNNFVLTGFLGLCPFVGASRRFEAAVGMALATLFVLTLASGLSYAIAHWILEPLALGYLRTVTFILLIAGVVQLAELMVRSSSPVLYELLGVYLPLITTNCAVLGVALMNQNLGHNLLESLVFGAAAAAGFGLVLLLFSALRERLETVDLPSPFRGAPIALITAGLMALAFMGFSGLASR